MFEKLSISNLDGSKLVSLISGFEEIIKIGRSHNHSGHSEVCCQVSCKKPVVVELFNLMLKLTFQFYFFTCVGSKRDKAEKDDKFTVEILKTSDGHLSPKSKYFYETVNSFNTKRATKSQQ